MLVNPNMYGANDILLILSSKDKASGTINHVSVKKPLSVHKVYRRTLLSSLWPHISVTKAVHLMLHPGRATYACQILEAPPLPWKSLTRLHGNARDSNVSGLAEMLVDPNMHGASAWQKASFHSKHLAWVGVWHLQKSIFLKYPQEIENYSIKHSGKPLLGQEPSRPECWPRLNTNQHLQSQVSQSRSLFRIGGFQPKIHKFSCKLQ